MYLHGMYWQYANELVRSARKGKEKNSCQKRETMVDKISTTIKDSVADMALERINVKKDVGEGWIKVY
jgi:hypothetical protein